MRGFSVDLELQTLSYIIVKRVNLFQMHFIVEDK